MIAGWDLPRIERAYESQVVDFPAEDKNCPRCGASTVVHKTRTRKLTSLAHGAIEAREIQGVCPTCESAQDTVLRSRQLATVVPRHQRYGYDLIVWTGLRRYLDHLQRSEIQRMLEGRHGIHVSTGTISTLSDRFLRYLAVLHQQATPMLRQAMAGGYPLHLDATHHHGRGGHCVCYDAYRGWVLHAARIDGERTEELQPVVEQTVAWFGQPIAIVRDQSKACKAAVSSLTEEGVPDLLCHFHVLKTLGKRLLDRTHSHLKAVWRARQIGATLTALLRNLQKAQADEHRDLATAVLWVIRGGDHTPSTFPFGLPILDQTERLLVLRQQLPVFLNRHQYRAAQNDLEKLEQLASEAEENDELKLLASRLRTRKTTFDEVRSLFRLASPGAPAHRFFPQTQYRQNTAIENDFDRYLAALPRRIHRAFGDHQTSLISTLTFLSRVRGQLFGHPTLRDNGGRIQAVVDRTNNPLEHFFGRQAQAMRRQTGRKNLGRDLDDLPAEAALVHNLTRPDYVRIVAGSIDRLPEKFAQLKPLSNSIRPRPLKPLKSRIATLEPLLARTQSAYPISSDGLAATAS